METFSMEKMEKPLGNSPFSPFYAIGPPPHHSTVDLRNCSKTIKIDVFSDADPESPPMT